MSIVQVLLVHRTCITCVLYIYYIYTCIVLVHHYPEANLSRFSHCSPEQFLAMADDPGCAEDLVRIDQCSSPKAVFSPRTVGWDMRVRMVVCWYNLSVYISSWMGSVNGRQECDIQTLWDCVVCPHTASKLARNHQLMIKYVLLLGTISYHYRV